MSLVLVVGCGEYNPFNREALRAETRLIAPGVMTPAIAVATEVEGAPAEWRIGEKVAKGLLTRDFLASTAPPGRSTYVLRGALRRVHDGGVNARYDVTWELFDAGGLSVGRTTHMALMERDSRAGRAEFADSLAEAAAIKVAQLVNAYAAHINSIAGARNTPAQSADRRLRDGAPETGISDGDDDELILPGKPLTMPPRAERTNAPAPPPRNEHAERVAATTQPAPRADIAPRPLIKLAEGKAIVPPGNGQHWLQVGSHKDEAVGRAEWDKLRAQGGELFGSAQYRIVRADLGAKGIYYRVQVGPFATAGEAMQLCQQMKARKFDCFLAPATGVAVAPKNDSPPPDAAAPKAPPAEKPGTVAKGTPAAKKIEPRDPGGKADVLGSPGGSANSAKPPGKDAPTSTAPGLPGVLD